jgi:hypothetical protein
VVDTHKRRVEATRQLTCREDVYANEGVARVVVEWFVGGNDQLLPTLTTTRPTTQSYTFFTQHTCLLPATLQVIAQLYTTFESARGVASALHTHEYDNVYSHIFLGLGRFSTITHLNKYFSLNVRVNQHHCLRWTRLCKCLEFTEVWLNRAGGERKEKKVKKQRLNRADGARESKRK